jgi:hypothetical protein
LFGDAVRDAFPSASHDIQEAGNCLAVGCGTATVFHLMRAAEYALRALANDRDVKIPKDVPIDLATWEDLLRQLEITETAIQQNTRTAAREAQYRFYHGAMMELRAFKNKFRNAVMHTRDSYDPDEALSAFNHVRDFMVILAEKISENSRSPTVWTDAWLASLKP